MKCFKEKYVLLSHILDEKTPAYGGGCGLTLDVVKSLGRGDSCNSVNFNFSNHLGTHVDCPLHFVKGGKSVTDFFIDDWIYEKPYIVDITVNEGTVITVSCLERVLSDISDLDLLLIRTGFEKKRNFESYWRDSPCFDPRLAAYLTKRFPMLKSIGMDTISISSLKNKKMGRDAHLAFLEKEYRIFEDLSLKSIPAGESLSKVLAIPLFVKDLDGSPCTIIGLLE